jgi:S1-C subfamily serine protease
VAFTAKMARAKRILRFCLLAALFAGSVFFAPASASDYPWFDKAIIALNKARGTTDASKQADDLNWAVKDINKEKLKQTDIQASAIALVQSAISDLEAGDSSKETEDITQAIAKIQEVTGSSEESTVAQKPAASPDQTPASPVIPDHAVVTIALTEDQARAVVLIAGDNAEGTGFLVKTAAGPVVVTNLHVISNNPNLKITTNTGQQITVLSLMGASDRDLAMIAIKDDNYSYLPLAADVSGTAQPGDEVITPGNSEGGDVVLNTDGKVLGIGPEKVEFDNPIYHGNSGGPVFHRKSGEVLGVVTEAEKVDVSDDLDKTSFANRNSAIGGSMRYFGLRVDTVPNWEPYDWQRFQGETAFLDQFDKRSRCLDSYLNTPNDNKPDSILYLQDDKIVKADASYFDQANGADGSQKIDALREWMSDLEGLVETDMDTIQQADNFYSFDQQRARDEIAYRKALKKELDNISTNISRMSSLPRGNN